MSKKVYDIAWPEEYESKGETKTQWHNCGTMFVDQEDGRMSFNLHSVPAVPFSGYFSVFEKRERDERGTAPAPADRKQYQPATPQHDDVVLEDIDDKPIDLSDIPF